VLLLPRPLEETKFARCHASKLRRFVLMGTQQVPVKLIESIKQNGTFHSS
jgi:hypothetical protein